MKARARGADDPGSVLGDLIRIRSDTGADMAPVLDYASGFLERRGLAARRFSFPGTSPALVARLAGRRRDSGGGRALVLLCHLDTAPFDPTEWRVDPLGAALVNGRIFGRGAIDCKGLAAVWLSLLSRYSAEGWAPPFDLVLVASTDEESERPSGLESLLRETRELDGAFLGLGEGGGFPLPYGRGVSYTVQTGEMDEYPPSAGPPRPGVLERIGMVAEGLRLGAYTSETVICALRGTRRGGGSRRLARSPLATWAREGPRSYIAPLGGAAARAAGATGSGLVPGGRPGGAASGLSSIRRALRAAGARAGILPLITIGHSDNRFLRLAGIPTLGFFPLDPANSISGIHGPNEYLSIDSLRLAESYLDATIRDLAAKG